MASLRRSNLLGYSTGLLPHYIDGDGAAQFGTPPANEVAALPIAYYFDDEGVSQFGTRPANQVIADPIPSTEKKNEEIANSSTGPNLLIQLGSCSLNNQNDEADGNDSNSLELQLEQPAPAGQAKPKRKRLRVKLNEGIKLKKKHKNEKLELFSLTGVYYKNHSWQAAIKVEKKQIHLGTYESQVEAARVYDRAAFMSKRKMNFDLPMEEKEELMKMTWNEFLNKTKLDLNLKKRTKYLQEARARYWYLEVPALRNKRSQGTEGASSSSSVVAKE